MTDSSHAEKTIKSLLLQESYGKDIEDQAIKAGIEESASDFHQIAEICLHKSIKMQGDRISNLITFCSGLEGGCVWATGKSPSLFIEYSPSLIQQTTTYYSNATCSDFDAKRHLH